MKGGGEVIRKKMSDTHSNTVLAKEFFSERRRNT
jgi:hypothetical protein